MSAVNAVPMSQWPSDHRYIIPVAPGPDLATVTIDGKQVQVPRGELLIKVAQEHGTYIPRFCWHERMKPVGMCRMCLVEVEGLRGLQISCSLPVTDGMVVHTDSDLVKHAQDGVLEFLLINHPLDCPVCDRGGECPLQDQTLAFGPGESRFVEEKRHFEKPIPISELILLDRERCIQCGRCTRFAAEIVNEPLIDFGGRSGETEVIVYPDEPFRSYFSGNTVQICPVGALTSSQYRFRARPWDLSAAESSCQACAVGCRVSVESTTNRVVRLLGVDSEPVNQGWLCDAGRYGFEWVHSGQRVRTPMVRDGKAAGADGLTAASWPVALAAAAAGLERVRDTHGPEAIAFLGGARGTNEDAYTWCRLMKGVIGTDNTDAQLADGLPADVVLGLPRAVIGDLDRAKAIVVIAGDLREELPILHLRIRRAAVDLGVPLVEVSARTTGLSRDATVLRAVPGEQARAVEPLVSLLRGDERRATAAGRDGDMLASFAAALEGRDGPVVVVVGRPSVAETADATVQAAARLAQVPGTRFLSALHRGNVHGALDLGLAPGFLPGRVTLDAGRDHVGATWGTVPERRGLDAAGILRAAADGEVRALVLLGCDPLGDFPDRRLAERAIANVEFLLVVGAFAEDAAERANVVLAASVWSEHRGSGSNLEGRVQRLAAKITAEGTTMASWQIACELAARFGSDFGLETVEDVQNEIAAVAPAFAGVDARLIRQARDGVVIPISDHPDELAFGPTQGASGRSWEPIRPTIADDGTDAFTEEEARARRTHRPPMPLHAWTAESARPGPAVPVNAYALRLVAGRTLYGDDRHTIHSPSVARLIEPARLLVNPADRDRVVTSEGAVVRVSTPTASLDLPVHADRATPRGVAFLAVNRTAPGARDLIDIDAPVTELRMETTS